MKRFLQLNLFFYLVIIALPTFLTNNLDKFDIMDYPQNVEKMWVILSLMSLVSVLMSSGFSKTIDYINENCDDFTTFKEAVVVYVFSFALLYLAGFNFLFQYLYL